MEYQQRPETIVLVMWQGYGWMTWLGLEVLLLEALVLVLRPDLPTFIAFLSLDICGALVGAWIIRMKRQKPKPDAQQLCCSPLKNHQNDKEPLELLQQAGFTPAESERLQRLRRRYLAHGNVWASADLSRLQFVRWLVETGKLTDQL